MNRFTPNNLDKFGFVVKDRLDNVVAAYYLTNETELADLVRQTRELGFLLYYGDIIVDDNGKQLVSNTQFRYTDVLLSKAAQLKDELRPEYDLSTLVPVTRPVGPARHVEPVAPVEPVEPVVPTKTPDEVIREAYHILKEAGEAGVEQSVVLGLMAGVISTTPAFSLRMKSFLAGDGDNLMLERYGKPVRYRFIKTPQAALQETLEG